MANLNKVLLMGNLTADPEVRYTPKGTAVTDLRLAINRYYVGENNDRQEETTFADVTLWNRQATIAGDYLRKGSGVFVEGRLQLDSWEDKSTGQKRTKLRVIGENIQLLPRGGDNGGARQNSGNYGNQGGYSQPRQNGNYGNQGGYSQPRQDNGGYGNPPAGNSAPAAEPPFIEDDDIPF